jgi:HAD superfamily hydrolase (TIGR01509 family)
MQSAVELVVLDMGGVLLELHDPLPTFGLDMDQHDFMESWLLSQAVGKLERGDMNISQFATVIVEEFALPYSPAEFVHRFESWPDAIYEGVPELLTSVGRHYRLALLSNTSETHWNRDDIGGQLTPLFHEVFLSYRTRHLKPEPAAFEDVIQHFSVDAGRILFLDDNPLNIVAAKGCGMQAQLTRGFDSLIQNLGPIASTFRQT